MEARPSRIVSLLAAATEMLFACGAGDDVVGVSHECNAPPQARSRPAVSRTRIDSTLESGEIDRQVSSCIAAGESLYTIDTALLESLDPELIVTQAQCDVCAIRYADVLDALHASDRLDTTNVVALNPQSLEGILNDCLRVGQAAGRRSGAEELVSDMRHRIDAVRKKTVRIAEADLTRVAIVEWTDPLMLASNWTPELVALAGGACPLTTAGRHSGYADWADVLRFDPEVIVVTPCGFDLPRACVDARRLALLDHWGGISAVREGRVFAVDGDAYFNRAGPRIVDSLEILAHLVRPELFDPPDVAPHGTAWIELDF